MYLTARGTALFWESSNLLSSKMVCGLIYTKWSSEINSQLEKQRLIMSASVPGNMWRWGGPPLIPGGGPRGGGPRDTPGGGGPGSLVMCGDEWGTNGGGGADCPDEKEPRLDPPSFWPPETTRTELQWVTFTATRNTTVQSCALT